MAPPQPNSPTRPPPTGYKKAMNGMMMGMDHPYSGNADRDFVTGMLPHHQGAVDMARVELQYGSDPALKKLARDIIASQTKEQAFMRQWLAHPPGAVTGRDGGAPLEPIPGSPAVILVRPQLADNIGSVARAMGNGGLFHLRLVAPRDGWPQERAWRMASGADRILDAATVHDTVADASGGFAACVRDLPPSAPHRQAGDHRARRGRGSARSRRREDLRCGILFGPERAGLDNDDMAEADTLVRFSLNPEFMSLNLVSGGDGHGL